MASRIIKDFIQAKKVKSHALPFFIVFVMNSESLILYFQSVAQSGKLTVFGEADKR